MICLLAFNTASTTHGQSIDIKQLETGLGIYIIRTDKIDLIDYYTNNVHIINITEYQLAFTKLKISANQIAEPIAIVEYRTENGRTIAMQKTERLRRALCIDCGDCLETLDWEDEKLDTLKKYYEEEGLLTEDGPKRCRICNVVIRRYTRTASFAVLFVPKLDN